MKKRILSFFLAVVIMFTVFVPVPDLVFATTEDIFLPPDNSVNSLITVGLSVDKDYYNNISMQYKDIYKKVVAEIREHIITVDSFNYSGDHYQVYIPFIDIDDYECELVVTNFELNWTMESGVLKLIPSTTSTQYSIYYIGFDSDYNYMNHYGDYSNVKRYAGSTEITFLPDFYDIAFPSDSEEESGRHKLYGVLVGQKVDKLGFFDWFEENNKIDYVKSCGFNLALSQIEFIIDWWAEYGSSPLRIVLGLPSLISKINIISWDISLATELVNIFDALYLEYQEYLKKDEREAIELQYPNGTLMPHHRTENYNPEDDKLSTDLEDDDIIVSLLRDIRKILMYLPQDIATHLSYIETYLDAILIDFNRLLIYLDSMPDYIAAAYNVFMDPINQIIEALGNVGSSTNIEIEIPETKKDEVDLFFDEWHTNFSDAINNKVPVYSQLSSLFNDDFFEKCGLDVNGDGETFAYYTAPGSVGSGDVQTLALNTSALSDSGEHVAVRSLLEQFDHADTSYLDDASYSGDIPEGWTVTVGGQDIEIFDFRIYAKHRTKIHVIITFILYSTYLLSLLKSIPTLIGNVSDVRNAFDAHSQKEE